MNLKLYLRETHQDRTGPRAKIKKTTTFTSLVNIFDTNLIDLLSVILHRRIEMFDYG